MGGSHPIQYLVGRFIGPKVDTTSGGGSCDVPESLDKFELLSSIVEPLTSSAAPWVMMAAPGEDVRCVT
jgi:hypothetical protein